MSAREVRDLARACRTAVVAVPGRDGFPLATLALVATGDDAGELLVEVAADDPVAQTLTAGSAACVVADTWPDYAGIRGLIVRGSSRAGSDELVVDRLASFDFSRADPS